MKKLARVHVEKMVQASKGHYFGATFVKKDGSKRTVNARLGVKKYLKGGKNNVVKASNSYVTVFDRHKSAYITMNLATVTNLAVNGERYEVV